MKRLTFILMFFPLPGCGYQNSVAPTTGPAGQRGNGYHWSSLYRGDVHTVAVPIFSSKDFNRGVEFEVSKALVNELEAHSSYKVVPRERADTILEGEIVSVRVNTLSNDFLSAIPQEQVVTVTVNFTWKDLRNGKILVERRGFEQAATYYATLGEGRFYGQQQAAERVALAIVQELQSDW
jgi:hypothetical protein